MLACSETRLQRDVDSLPSLEHVPPPAVASAAAATAPAVKPPPPSKQAKQALDEVWRTIIPCLEAADLLSATCHYHHPELCKVEEGEVFCNATRKLIDEGKATVRDDGGLELDSSSGSSCHRLRQALRDFPRLLAGGSALNAPAERPSARPALDLDAVAFAARAAELTAEHAVAASAPASQPPAAIPEGAELRGARLVVSAAVAAPSHSVLAAVTAHNKRGTAGATLQPEWSLTREGETATVNVAALWAAMCAAGGIRQARKRGGPAVLRAVRSIPGQEGFPESLVKALLDRIDSWLLPMYGPREEDELAAIEPDQLRAVLQRGIAEGALQGPADAVVVCSPALDRMLLLAAMQARSIQLPHYDVVVARGQAHDVPLEAFWAHLSSAGGVQQVLSDKSALKCVVAASGLNEAAITAAATLLLPLAAFTASAALSPELQALLDAPLQDQLPTLP
ncbi:hypothetical protein C2E20_7491 [Micractinium conductrix]|uniref:Uncharacterized protein n=1 Tax=Micractinium conductrix TaxID=554055 RepID=A0A2P6V4H1_9CHLO|nr:hypothetical protein C2E20_7491 [Micractinium conductrix]|eukprot:PSC68990.1 hypothetical protein C2E20_7491 [Micractinium conductrix]